MPESFVSVTQAAAQLGVGQTTIRRWIAEGRLQAYRVGNTRTTRIPAAQLDSLFAPVVEK